MFDNKIVKLPCRSTACKKKCKSVVQCNVVHSCSRHPSSEAYLSLPELKGWITLLWAFSALQFNDPMSLHEQILLLTLAQDMAQLHKKHKILGFYYDHLNLMVSMHCS